MPREASRDRDPSSCSATRDRRVSWRPDSVSLTSRWRSPRNAFSADGNDYPAGSWILPSQDGLGDALETVAKDLALDFDSSAAMPSVESHAAEVPRLGVWVPWADTDSIGWLRYTLDQQGVPYTYLRDEDIRAGTLEDKVDLIVYGNVDLELTSQIHGIESVDGPMPFNKTAEFPSHGEPAESEDITGGIGWSGLASLQAFVEQGGLLLTLGNGSSLALDGGMIRNVRRAHDTGISTPGAEIRTSFLKPDHPIAYGYSETPSVFRFNYAVYDLPKHWLRMAYCTSCLDGDVDKSSVVLQWGAESQPMVVSGGAKGEEAATGPPGDPGGTDRQGCDRGLQLQPHAPLPEPLGPSLPLERDHQLAAAHRDRALARAVSFALPA